MATRLGIELSPAACRIVEVDAGLAWRRHARDTRVRSFAVFPPSGPETRAKLVSLRKRHAAVVVWNGPSDHRQVVVTGGSYESMRAEALGALAAAGLNTGGVWADIAPASRPANRTARRPVVVAMAPAAEMSAALQPLVDAGIRVRAVTTPAMALASLARLRRTFSVPEAIEAYVAFEEDVTCIALVRGGVLIAARELPWGYVDERDPHRQPLQRDDVTTRLADAITDFIAGIGGSAADVGQLCVCGGLPDLRSMTAPLMERFDVEVEPLDSLFGIDVARLPEPVNEFRERGAELRLAWAVAADWPSPINLLRLRRRRTSKTMLARAAVVTGVAAGLVAGWRLERSPLWRLTETNPTARTATNVPPRAQGPARAPSPPPAVASKPLVVPPPAVASEPPIAPPPAVAIKPPVAPTGPVVVNGPLVATAPRQPTVAQAPPAAVSTAPREERPRPATAAPTVRPAEVALPFDAVLGTILYSPDRQLAIVDGRIVGPGDEVRGARVVEITPSAVMLRDGQGRLRRLALTAEAR
jgi:hypothetical protein